MTLAWRATALGLAVSCTLVGCAPAGADAEREPAAATCGLGPLPARGETRTVLEGDDLREGASIGVGAVLADGSVVVSYDLNPIDEDDAEQMATEKPEPGLLHLREDSCEDVPLPTIDGLTVAADAVPVAADDEGRLYLFEGWPVLRLVRGTPSADDWETVVVLPSPSIRSFGYAPDVSVSDTGEVFVGTDFLVSRVTATGDLEPIIGTGEGDGRNRPLPGTGTFPRAGTSAPLTSVTGIAATPSGTLVLTSFLKVMEWDPSGTLRLLADPGTPAGQEGAIQERTFAPGDGRIGSVIGHPHVTDDGDILIGELLDTGDATTERLLAIRNGRSTVLAELEDFLSPNPGSALFPGDAAILLRDGGRSLALYGLPAD